MRKLARRTILGLAIALVASTVCALAMSGIAHASTVDCLTGASPTGSFTIDDATHTITGQTGCAGTAPIPSGVTTIGNAAFSGDVALTSVAIPASVITIGDVAFAGTTALTTVTFAAGSSLTSIGANAFANSGLTGTIAIPANVTSIGDSAFFYDSHLTGVTFASGSSLTTIGPDAFEHCDLTGSITIPASVDTLGFIAFSYNPHLTNVTFEAGSALSTIEDGVFQSSGLTTIVLPAGITSIGNSAFKSTPLSSIVIPSTVTSIGSSAFQETALTTLAIPASVTTIGSGAFFGSNTLTGVTFAPGDTPATIGDYAFAGTGLTSIAIPTRITSLGASAFEGDNHLTDVAYARPSSITTVASMTFSGTPLTSIVLPPSITSLADDAFTDALSLADFYFTGIAAPTVGAGAFSSAPPSAMAYRKTTAAGFGSTGTIWNGLIVADYPTAPLTVTVRGGGTVTSSPAGIDCGTTCSASLTTDTTLILSASASTGYVFAGWNGDGCSGTGSCTVPMTAARGVTATFEESPRQTETPRPTSAAAEAKPTPARAPRAPDADSVSWRFGRSMTAPAGGRAAIIAAFPSAVETVYAITAAPTGARRLVHGTCRRVRHVVRAHTTVCTIRVAPGPWTIAITPEAHGVVGTPLVRRITIRPSPAPAPPAVTG